jgi:hypothetical protein
MFFVVFFMSLSYNRYNIFIKRFEMSDVTSSVYTLDISRRLVLNPVVHGVETSYFRLFKCVSCEQPSVDLIWFRVLKGLEEEFDKRRARFAVREVYDGKFPTAKVVERVRELILSDQTGEMIVSNIIDRVCLHDLLQKSRTLQIRMPDELEEEECGLNFQMMDFCAQIPFTNTLYGEQAYKEFMHLYHDTRGIGVDIDRGEARNEAQRLKEEISLRKSLFFSVKNLEAVVLDKLARLKGIALSVLEEFLMCRELYSVTSKVLKMRNPLKDISIQEKSDRFFGGVECAAIALRHIVKSLRRKGDVFSLATDEDASHTNVTVKTFHFGAETAVEEAKVRFYYASYMLGLHNTHLVSRELSESVISEKMPRNILKSNGIHFTEPITFDISDLRKKIARLDCTEPKMLFLGLQGTTTPGHALAIRIDSDFHILDPQFGKLEYSSFEDLIEGVGHYLSTMYPEYKNTIMFELSLS